MTFVNWRGFPSLFLIAVLVISGCASKPPEIRVTRPHAAKPRVIKPRAMGRASWYGPRFEGKRTANGEIFHASDLTAGHRSLPLGSRVEVTNLKTGKKVQVRINDRGPYVRGRTLDLSRAAAERLGMIHSGVAPVSIKVISNPETRYRRHAHSRRPHNKHKKPRNS